MENSSNTLDRIREFIFGGNLEQAQARQEFIAQLMAPILNDENKEDTIEGDSANDILASHVRTRLLNNPGSAGSPELEETLDLFEEIRTLNLQEALQEIDLTAFKRNTEALLVSAKRSDSKSIPIRVTQPVSGAHCTTGVLSFQFDRAVTPGMRVRILNNKNERVVGGNIPTGITVFDFPLLDENSGQPLSPGWYVWSILVDSSDIRDFFYVLHNRSGQ